MLWFVIGGLLVFFGFAGALAFGVGAWSSSKLAKEFEDDAGKHLVKASRRGGVALAYGIVGLIGIGLIVVNLLNF